MSYADIAICILIVIGAYAGYKEGFLMELFSLLALLLGVLGGFKLMGWAMLYITEHFDVDKDVLPYVAFGVVFIAIVILVRMLGNMIKLSLDKSFLGRVDQVAGGFLGVLKTAFILSVIIWLIDSFRVHYPDQWTDDSWVFPKVAAFAPAVTAWIGEWFPIFRDVF